VRIGLFHATLPSADRKVGGVEAHVHRLATKLVERGHAVTVFTVAPATADTTYRTIAIFGGHVSSSALSRMVLVPLALNFVDFSDLDVLHLHGDDWFFVRRTVPTVRTFHGSSWNEARHATRIRLWLRQLATFPLEILSARLSTARYAVGPDSLRIYRAAGLLPCGVDIDTRPRTERVRSVLFVGTWDGRKRGRFLWDIFIKHVRPRVPDAELWMVADACLPAAGVTWHRAPSDDELMDLYRRATVFCLPSTYEGFGIPYLEAMANGAPVVATPNTGAEALLGPTASGVIAIDSELGPTLVDLLGDRVRREDLRARGFKRAEHYAWPHVIADHELAYEAAIARSKGTTSSP
jgi:phosphatidylinositol alpha-mannosyltransferase